MIKSSNQIREFNKCSKIVDRNNFILSIWLLFVFIAASGISAIKFDDQLILLLTIYCTVALIRNSYNYLKKKNNPSLYIEGKVKKQIIHRRRRRSITYKLEIDIHKAYEIHQDATENHPIQGLHIYNTNLHIENAVKQNQLSFSIIIF